MTDVTPHWLSHWRSKCRLAYLNLFTSWLTASYLRFHWISLYFPIVFIISSSVAPSFFSIPYCFALPAIICTKPTCSSCKYVSISKFACLFEVFFLVYIRFLLRSLSNAFLQLMKWTLGPLSSFTVFFPISLVGSMVFSVRFLLETRLIILQIIFNCVFKSSALKFTRLVPNAWLRKNIVLWLPHSLV